VVSYINILCEFSPDAVHDAINESLVKAGIEQWSKFRALTNESWLLFECVEDVY